MECEFALQVKNLCKSYPQFTLSDVSFSVPKGAIMGLIGENGAGKSTVMKIILGMTRADGGKISVFGHEGVAAWDKEKIGVVFDELPFNQTLTVSALGKVMQNIYSEWDMQVYQGYLSRFSLPDKKELKDFSKGMKMKLSLAVALSHHAKLLILDEPTGGLDPVVRAEILDLFLEFIADGESSILVSSHITGDLEQIADYITFLHQGKLMMSKNKDDIIYRYGIAKADPRTIEAIGSSFVVKKKIGQYGAQALIENREEFAREYPDILVDPITLDALMLFLCTEH